jgi:mRNA-degrading endonuclease toxin of MazEF toxin-antitoxin module
MLEVKRGDIFFVERQELKNRPARKDNKRPLVILSADAMRDDIDYYVAAYITLNQSAPEWLHVGTYATGVKAYIICEALTTVPRHGLEDYAGCCTEEELQKVDKALLEIFGLSLPEQKKVAKVAPAAIPAPAPKLEKADEIAFLQAKLQYAEAMRDEYKALYLGIKELTMATLSPKVVAATENTEEEPSPKVETSVEIEPKQRPPKRVEDTGIVYIGVKDTRYHRRGCPYLPQTFSAATLEDMDSLNGTPCPYCKPPVLSGVKKQ